MDEYYAKLKFEPFQLKPIERYPYASSKYQMREMTPEEEAERDAFWRAKSDKKSTPKKGKLLAAYEKAKDDLFEQWTETQEYKEALEKHNKSQDAHYAAQDSIKPGTVLQLKNGKYLLVGDVNPLLGVCDDCQECHYEDIEFIARIF